MQAFSVAKGFQYVWEHTWPALTEKETNRLRAVLLLRQRKQPWMVCQLFGISKATLYRWHQFVDPRDPRTLREKSRGPKRLRKPQWTLTQIVAVGDLRGQYPRWTREKLATLPEGQGIRVPAS